MSSGDGSRKKDDEVGYGKPPKAHRFQLGQSGNPLGRPKGSRNKKGPLLQFEPLKKIIAKEAYREVPVREGDEIVTVPMAEAVMRALGLKAAKGDHRSQKLFTELVGATEAQMRRDHEETVQAGLDYKKRARAEVEQREHEGVTDAPDILPHPDHVDIDLSTMNVHFNGPCTPRQKKFYDMCFKDYCKAFDAQHEIAPHIERQEDPESRKNLSAYVEHQKMLQKLITDEVGKGIGSAGMKHRFLIDTYEYRMKAIRKDSKQQGQDTPEEDGEESQ